MKKRRKLISWIVCIFIIGIIFTGIGGVLNVKAADSEKSTTMTDEEVDKFIDDWIKNNIKDSMTDYDKAYKIYEYIGSYSYNYKISNYYNFIRYGQGDCFAFSYAYQRFCNEVGLTCYTRWADMDKNAGSNHRNNVIYIDGTYYIVDCNARAIGGERFDKQENAYLYTIENGKATYVQYFGIGGKVEIPSAIEGYPVTEIEKNAFCCDNEISVVKIPASIEKLPEPFATSTGKEEYTVKEFQIDKENLNYKSVNGDIYSKDGKRLIFFAPNKADFIVEDGTEIISDYAGWNAGRGTELYMSTNMSTGKTTPEQAMDSIKLPNSLRKIGKKSFGNVLGDLTIPEGVGEIGDDIANDITGWLILPASLKKIGTISTDIVIFQSKDVEIGRKSGRVETVFAFKGGKIEQFCRKNDIQFVSEEEVKLQKDWFKLSADYVSLSNKAPSWLQKNMYEVEQIDEYSMKVVAKKVVTGSIIISHTVGIKDAREATCTKTGYEGTEYCIDCGIELKSGKSIPVLGHQWEEVEIQKPTCTGLGKKKYICSRCNYSYVETISATGHDWKTVEIIPSTCHSKEKEKQECTQCHLTQSIVNENSHYEDHQWEDGDGKVKCKICKNFTHLHVWKEDSEKTVKPTCSQVGSKIYYCTSKYRDWDGKVHECHSTKTETLAKTSHIWKDNKCEVCGATHEHDWQEETNLAQLPTCTKDGSKTYKCSTCGKEKTEVVLTTGHQWKSYKKNENTLSKCKCTVCGLTKAHDRKVISVDAPTCTTARVFHWQCKDCGQRIKGTDKDNPALGHDWKNSEGECSRCGEKHTHDFGDWKITLTPTCCSEGEQTGICVTCGWEESSILAKTDDHEWGEWQTVKEANCIETGEKKRTCEKCEKTETEILPKTEHTIEVVNIKVATCKETGYTGDKICKICKQTIEVGTTIEKFSHIPKTVGVKIATCKDEGYTGDRVCEICGEVLEKGTNLAKINNHQWGEWALVKSPTCTEKGEKTRTCENCGKIETEEVSATGHQHTELSNVKAPNCAEKGYTGDTYCKDCKQLLKKGEEVVATGHNWKKTGIIVPNYNTEGKEIWTCEKCNTTKITILAKLPMPKAGTKLTVGKNVYIVTMTGSEVYLNKADNKTKAITIPNVIKVNGVIYKVTGISAKSFENCKKLTSITIGSNVLTIKTKAFNNCPKLKKVIIKTTKLSKKTVSKKSFSKVNKQLIIKVPKKAKKTYIKFFKGYKVK